LASYRFVFCRSIVWLAGGRLLVVSLIGRPLHSLLFDLLAGWLAGYLLVGWMPGIALLMDNFCWLMIGWLGIGYGETVGC
jgi:hypothetical protein